MNGMRWPLLAIVALAAVAGTAAQASDHVWGSTALAPICQGYGKPDPDNQAVSACTEIIQGADGGTDELIPRAYVDRGLAYCNLAQYDLAVRDFESAEALDQGITNGTLEFARAAAAGKPNDRCSKR